MIREGRGRAYLRGTAGFDAAVLGTSFNARDPGRRPGLVVQANDVFDVVAAVKRARAEGLKIGVCSGGHSWAQNHIREGGLMLDLSRLTALEIDAQAGIARVGPGMHGGDFDAALAKAGFFFPVAHAYTVGLGGFLLQGGFGWNSRKVGLACESVIGFDAVLADGSLVHASADENPDLYWAARGSGPGFFAVVVRWHLRLHRRPRFVGLKMQIFRMQHLEEVFEWADAVGPTVSDSVEFQMVVQRRATGIFAPGIEVIAPVLADSRREARQAVDFITKGPLAKKAAVTFPLIPMPLGTMMKTGEKTLFLTGTRWSADNMWMNGPIQPLIPAVRAMAESLPPHPSHMLWLNWNAPESRPDMAFSVEGRTYLALYGGLRNREDEIEHGGWAGRHIRAAADHGVGIQLADENLANRPARFATDENMKRLDAVRAAYDPDGVFHPWMGRVN